MNRVKRSSLSCLLGGCGVAAMTAYALGGCVGILQIHPVPEQDAGTAGNDAQPSADSGLPDATLPDASDGGTRDASRDSSTDVPDATLPDASDSGTADTGTADTGTVSPPADSGIQSCLGGGAGLSNCGTDGGESCCLSLPVDGGTFTRVFLDPNSADGGLVFVDAAVSTFQLDKYLVTVGRFRKFTNALFPPGGTIQVGFLDAGAGKHSYLNDGGGLSNWGDGGGSEPGWIYDPRTVLAPTSANLLCTVSNLNDPYPTWTEEAGVNENLPVNCVSWYEAYAFCIWDGAFLPSDTELEYARAGGAEQRVYPWGNEPTPLDIDPIHDGPLDDYVVFSCDHPDGSNLDTCSGVANIAPVGYAWRGAGRWQQVDLLGDEQQWTLDWLAHGIVPPSCSDCANTLSPYNPGYEDFRLERGACYQDDGDHLAVQSAHSADAPEARTTDTGFRCARAP